MDRYRVAAHRAQPVCGQGSAHLSDVHADRSGAAALWQGLWGHGPTGGESVVVAAWPVDPGAPVDAAAARPPDA